MGLIRPKGPEGVALPAIKDLEHTLNVTNFQNFDRDQEVEEFLPAEWNLHPGDRFYWVCFQFDGVAEVVGRGKLALADTIACMVKKIS